MGRSEKILLFGCFGLVFLCSCVAIICGLTLKISGVLPKIQSELNTWVMNGGSQTPIAETPSSAPTQESHTFSESPCTTLNALTNTIIPQVDWIQLYSQFNGVTNIPRTLMTAPVQYIDGDTVKFWVSNEDTNINTQITATLQYQTDSIYFWVENGIEFNKDDLKKDAETFASKIYPTDQKFFGKEWIPGVDNDPHLYVLYTRGMGTDVAGYESDSDEYLSLVQPYSNQHEMFYINADVQRLSDPYTLSVMAHEFQHLIHAYHDGNEELWLNEGFSELASYLNGYDEGGFDQIFAANPDVDLIDWPNDASATDIHYGSSFLFTAYLLDRFGENTTKAVVADPLNGLNSLDDVFSKEHLIDGMTDKTVTSDTFFQDWTIANFLGDQKTVDGRYGYHALTDFLDFKSAQTTVDCDSNLHSGDVSQYGTDYVQLNCVSPFVLNFTGAVTNNILSEYPRTGSHYVWSNMADSSATTMTREFDFSQLSGPIALNYDVWYDIEQDFDFAYLLASTDDSNWKILDTPSCTKKNATGNNFGCGYSGKSNGWMHETVDLSQFAGKRVKLRFEYVTDAGVTGEGVVLDNLAIPQIHYETSFETDEGGWQLDGFIRIENQIPQTFLVSVIHGSGDAAIIEKYQVNSGEKLTINIDGNTLTILVVSGSSRYTRQKAGYQFSLVAQP
jgi:hypothetical protein